MSDLICSALSSWKACREVLWGTNVSGAVGCGGRTASREDVCSAQLAPTNLEAQVREADRAIDLTWENPDDPDFAGVKIVVNTTHFPTNLEDGELKFDSGEEDNTVQTYTLSNLTPGATYYIAIFAYDSFSSFDCPGRNDTSAPATVQALIPGKKPPQDQTPPEIMHQCIAQSEVWNALDISAQVTDNVAVQSVNVEYAARSIAMTLAGKNIYNAQIQAAEVGLGFQYRIKATDTSNNEQVTDYCEVAIDDNSAPRVPGNLGATSNEDQTTTVSWSAPTEDENGFPLSGLAGYEIGYRDTSVPDSTELTFLADLVETTEIASLINGHRYEIRIRAFDGSDNYSEWSNMVNAVPQIGGVETNAPEIANQTQTEIDIWHDLPVEVEVTDESAIAEVVMLYRYAGEADWSAPVALTFSGGIYSVNILWDQTSSNIEFQIRATDEYNNQRLSEIYTVTVEDNNPPATPSNLTAESNHNSEVPVSWAVPTFDREVDGNNPPLSGLSGYELSYGREGDVVPPTRILVPGGAAATTYTIAGLTNGQTYEIAIRAYDSQVPPNSSLWSAPTLATPQMEGVERNQPVVANQTQSQIDIWNDLPITAQVTDESAIATVEVYYRRAGAGAWIGPVALAPEGADLYSAVLDREEVSGDIEFYINAVDEYNNTRTSETYSVEITDNSPPATPANLRATSAVDGAIPLAWDALTNDARIGGWNPPLSGLTGYEVSYRIVGEPDPTIIQIGAVASYSLSPVTNGQEYEIQIRAFDAEGNYSDWTPIVTATPVGRDNTEPVLTILSPVTPPPLEAWRMFDVRVNITDEGGSGTDPSSPFLYFQRADLPDGSPYRNVSLFRESEFSTVYTAPIFASENTLAGVRLYAEAADNEGNVGRTVATVISTQDITPPVGFLGPFLSLTAPDAVWVDYTLRDTTGDPRPPEIVILRGTSLPPPSCPADGVDPPLGGEVIYKGTAERYDDIGLARGQFYTYRACPRDGAPTFNYSDVMLFNSMVTCHNDSATAVTTFPGSLSALRVNATGALEISPIATSYADEFNDDVIAPEWTVRRTGCATEEGVGWLQVYSYNGLNCTWPDGNPMVYQPIPTGNFTMETRTVNSTVGAGGSTGMMLYTNGDNAYLLDRFTAVSGSPSTIAVERYIGGVYSNDYLVVGMSTVYLSPLELKLEVSGNTVISYYKRPEDADFVEGFRETLAFAPAFVGFFSRNEAINRAEATSPFDYFHMNFSSLARTGTYTHPAINTGIGEDTLGNINGIGNITLDADIPPATSVGIEVNDGSGWRPVTAGVDFTFTAANVEVRLTLTGSVAATPVVRGFTFNAREDCP